MDGNLRVPGLFWQLFLFGGVVLDLRPLSYFGPVGVARHFFPEIAKLESFWFAEKEKQIGLWLELVLNVLNCALNCPGMKQDNFECIRL